MISATLAEYHISIADDDAVITQTTGFSQVDNLSPCLLSVLVSDTPSRVSERHPTVRIIMYANDVVMYEASRSHVMQALATLNQCAGRAGLTINKSKTEAVKFRGGGRLAKSDKFRLEGQQIQFVNTFTYLGLTLSATRRTFTRHIEERVVKTRVANATIKNPKRLSLHTAI